MLELYFKYPRVLRRLRSGALGQEMDRIAAHFSELGYKRGSAKVYISRLAKFSEFAARSAGGVTIEQDVIDRFVQSLRTATPRIAARTAIEHARRLAPARFSMPLRYTAPDPHGPLLGAYLDHLRHVRGLEPKTCDGLLVVARRILAWYDGDVPDQPLSAMTGEHVLDVTMLVGLLASTGLRSGEALRLDRADVDLAGGVLHIRKTKFRKDRLVPVHTTTLAALRQYAQHRDAAFDAACALAGQKGLRPHDLRHRFAVTRLAVWHREKADVQALLPLLATYLGHARYTDTAYYVTGTADLLGMAAERAFVGGGVA